MTALSSDQARIEALAQSWLTQDKNPSTRAEIQGLLDTGKYDELALRLGKRIGFGTAGLRARMEAGFARMNDLTVLQASQGLCAYVLQQEPKAKEMGVVIGHDHRHNSSRFAQLAAGVFLRNGIRVYLLGGLACTPLVPFSVKKLGAAAGVMVTASHNPAADNGYKVYWSNAVQIIPPHDAGIAASIDDNLQVPDEAWQPEELLVSSELRIDQTETLTQAYMETLAGLRSSALPASQDSFAFVYTPIHGVGFPFARSVLSTFGFPESTMHAVPSQVEPDPDFPTVKFPNPEEKGALDAACAHADEKGLKLVLANDPDADRFSAAEKDGDTWRQFTGDQLGVIFGVTLFRQYKAAGKPIDKLAMLASTVSSKMLAIVAKKEGFQFRETLTGFKWLGNEAQKLEKEGYSVAFAYEEAIGFMVSPEIRDKDGISALAVFATLASQLYASGQTISSYLASLYAEYGHFVTLNSYWISRDPAVTSRIFEALRSSAGPGGYPARLGEWRIMSLKDITRGYDSTESDGKLRALPVDATGQMLSFTLDVHTAGEAGVDGLGGTIRTSGTEPKAKAYLEGWGSDPAKVAAALQRVWDALDSEWLRADENGLERP